MGPPPPALDTRLVEDGLAGARTLPDREHGEPRREDPRRYVCGVGALPLSGGRFMTTKPERSRCCARRLATIAAIISDES